MRLPGIPSGRKDFTATLSCEKILALLEIRKRRRQVPAKAVEIPLWVLELGIEESLLENFPFFGLLDELLGYSNRI